jgi:hypothetical protein
MKGNDVAAIRCTAKTHTWASSAAVVDQVGNLFLQIQSSASTVGLNG